MSGRAVLVGRVYSYGNMATATKMQFEVRRYVVLWIYSNHLNIIMSDTYTQTRKSPRRPRPGVGRRGACREREFLRVL